MKLTYDTGLNNRKIRAEEYAIKVGEECRYDKHYKGFVVGTVIFKQLGVIEGITSREQADILMEALSKWAYGDNESKDEYQKWILDANSFRAAEKKHEDSTIETIELELDEELAEELAEVVVESTEKYNSTESVDDEHVAKIVIDLTDDNDSVECNEEDNTLSIKVLKSEITDSTYDSIIGMIQSYCHLMVKVFGESDLNIKCKDDRIVFPWFKATDDLQTMAAYRLFIFKLVEKAKHTTLANTSNICTGDDKYVFSKFLYRLGIDGLTYRWARNILLKNLDGAAWKNLTWKKKKEARDAIKNKQIAKNDESVVSKGA